MIIKRIYIVLFLVLISWNVNAKIEISRGNQGPDGGDEIGMVFRSLVFDVLNDIKLHYPDLSKNFSVEKVLRGLNSLEVVVVDYPLIVVRNGSEQESVAVNYGPSRKILVNRWRWKMLHGKPERSSIALHEVLSIEGYESTGNYNISSIYYSKIKDSVASDQSEYKYLTCHDMDSALMNVTMANEYLILQIAARSQESKLAIQEWARQMEIPNPEKIIGLHLGQYVVDMANREDLCELDSLNRSFINCKEASSANLSVIYAANGGGKQVFVDVDYFRTGESVNISQKGIVQFSISTRTAKRSSQLFLNMNAFTCD